MKELNAKNIAEEISKSENPILIEFWGSWCLPCQVMPELLEELERDFGERIGVAKINLDRNPLVTSQYKIEGVPTFILFKNGREIARKVGAQSKNSLSEMVKNSI